LAWLSAAGWRVVLAGIQPSETAAERGCAARQPADAGARGPAVSDVDYCCLEPGGGRILFGDAACRRATALLRRVCPDLVLTHSPLDRVGDHEETSRIVRQACCAAPLAEVVVDDEAGRVPPLSGVPYLYYFDPSDGVDMFGRPVRMALVVDITDVIEAKLRYMVLGGPKAAHAAELPEQVRTWGWARGRAAGCEAGEGFRRHEGRTFPDGDLLRDVLGGRVHVVE
jgi:LmbE family N-acetylglucosaminyl deacetylase